MFLVCTHRHSPARLVCLVCSSILLVLRVRCLDSTWDLTIKASTALAKSPRPQGLGQSVIEGFTRNRKPLVHRHRGPAPPVDSNMPPARRQEPKGPETRASVQLPASEQLFLLLARIFSFFNPIETMLTHVYTRILALRKRKRDNAGSLYFTTNKM